jgi:hypothetical protein
MNSSHDWIDLVYLNTLANSTGNDGGYEDYTYLSTNLQQGGSYDITLSAEIINGPHTESWTVWIDFNQDGDFKDAGERLVRYQSQQVGWESHTFAIPLNAPTGSTRMRVSMKRDSYQGACDSFAYGEVEDYTVNITGQTTNSIAAKLNNTSSQLLKIFPNPVINNLTVRFETSVSAENEIVISDLQGRKLISEKLPATAGTANISINVSRLTPGIYFIRLLNGSTLVSAEKFLKQ